MSSEQKSFKASSYEFTARVGVKFMASYRAFEHFATTCGELIFGFFAFFVDRNPIVWKNWRNHFYNFGPQRLVRLCFFNLVIAFIITSIAGLQLQKLNLGGYITDLITSTLVRTFTPLVVAMSILITTGKSFTQDSLERQTRINQLEENNLLRFRLVPENIAILFVLPFLYVFATFASLIGCLLASLWLLNMIPVEFLTQLQFKLHPTDYFAGILKVIVYALIIGMFKSHYYLISYDSRRDVANAVTRFFLNCAFWFVLFDFLVEFFLVYYGPQ